MPSLSLYTGHRNYRCSGLSNIINRRFHTFLRGVDGLAEALNSQHAISLFRLRTRDLTSPCAKNTAALPGGLLTLASAMPGFISFRHYTIDNDEMLGHATANAR